MTGSWADAPSLLGGGSCYAPNEVPVERDEVVRRVQVHRARLRELGVDSLSLFGSVARGEAQQDSDVDLLVRFHGAVTFDRFMDLKLFLEDLLGARIDLVTDKAIRPRLRAQVYGELLRVA